MMSNVAGYADASKSDWLVLKTSPRRVVILKTGDSVLAGTFDHKVLGNNFAVYKFDKDFPNPMVLETIGPLQPRQRRGELYKAVQDLKSSLNGLPWPHR